MNITPANLSTAAAAIQAVEQVASQSATPITGQQKLDAAIAFIGAVDPAVSAWIVPVQVLVNALVGVFNSLGIFKHGPVSSAT